MTKVIYLLFAVTILVSGCSFSGKRVASASTSSAPAELQPTKPTPSPSPTFDSEKYKAEQKQKEIAQLKAEWAKINDPKADFESQTKGLICAQQQAYYDLDSFYGNFTDSKSNQMKIGESLKEFGLDPVDVKARLDKAAKMYFQTLVATFNGPPSNQTCGRGEALFTISDKGELLQEMYSMTSNEDLVDLKLITPEQLRKMAITVSKSYLADYRKGTDLKDHRWGLDEIMEQFNLQPAEIGMTADEQKGLDYD